MEEEGTEQATGAESCDHSCLEQAAETNPRVTLSTDEGLSDRSVGISDEQALDGLAGHDRILPPDSVPLSDSPHSDGTPPISANPPEGDSLWVWPL